MSRPASRLAIAVLGAAVLVGCAAQPTRYAWGAYEDLVYVTYTKPGTLTPEMQADQLQKDRETARAAGKPLPPGWRAHLSYVYHQMGRTDLAREELAAEQAAFPEATTFVGTLLANLGTPTVSGAAAPAAGTGAEKAQ